MLDEDFKVTNTSRVAFERVELKVTLLDSNKNPLASETTTLYDLPGGEYESGYVSFF
jgi:hypothetical protein